MEKAMHLKILDNLTSQKVNTEGPSFQMQPYLEGCSVSLAVFHMQKRLYSNERTFCRHDSNRELSISGAARPGKLQQRS